MTLPCPNWTVAWFIEVVVAEETNSMPYRSVAQILKVVLVEWTTTMALQDSSMMAMQLPWSYRTEA